MNKASKPFTTLEKITVVAIIFFILYFFVTFYIDKTKNDFETKFYNVYQSVVLGIENYEKEFPTYHPIEEIESGTDRITFSFNFSQMYTYDFWIKNAEKNYENLLLKIYEFLPDNTYFAVNERFYKTLRNLPFTVTSRTPTPFGQKQVGDYLDVVSSEISINDDCPTVTLSDNNYVIHYGINDKDSSTYTLAFVYEHKTNNVQHIVLANDGCVSIDGGTPIRINANKCMHNKFEIPVFDELPTGEVEISPFK